MKSYDVIAEKGRVIAFVPNTAIWEKDELSTLANKMLEANEFVYKLYSGEIAIDDVPQKWKNLVQECVDYLSSAMEEATECDYQSALRDMGVDV